MKRLYIKLMIWTLSVHIFACYTKLLYHLNPDMTDHQKFTYMNMDEFKILAIVFAISYSVASAFAILASTDKKIIILFGVLDAIGVLLYYITYIPLQISAVYFSIYTCSLILSTIRTSKPLSISGLIIEMKSSGIPQKEIAKRLNISESKVSRILNKNSKKPK